MTIDSERLTSVLADRYRILRELGQGGMATVYLAEDIKHDRKVALKVLKPELAAVLGAERFVIEIKTTAALQHPHILPLFDSGTADGFLYYVMPFIDGESRGGVSALASLTRASAGIHLTVNGVPGSEKEFAKRANLARNALKHLEAGGGRTVELDVYQEAVDMLDRAISNYWELTDSLSPAMQSFERQRRARA